MEIETACSIQCLPDEMIILIMKRTSYADCNSFRQTCKKYNDLLGSSNSLWRVIYRKLVGKVIYNTTASQSKGNWIYDLQLYLNLRRTLIDLIVDMSPKHFDEDTRKTVGLDYVQQFFALALSNNTNYYLTVYIIQDFVQTAIKKLETYDTQQPYTLTEIHYGKIVLRYLTHVMFTLKWVHYHVTNQLTPDVVLNFFVQWIDPLHMHSDETVQDLIKLMISDVDRLLLNSTGNARSPGVKIQSTCPSGIYSEKEVLLAISHYMYKQRRMVLMPACNEDTLDIVKTIKTNTGHGACLGAIFEAIARGFGITSCNLIAFPNHLYLEWRNQYGFRTETMQFALDKGELRQSGRCPFSANMDPNERGHYKYSAEAFVQYIITSFLAHMGEFKSWQTDNAGHFLNFLTNNDRSEYCNFMLYLRGLDYDKLTIPFNMEYIPEEHIHCVYGLLSVNKTPLPRRSYMVVKERPSIVKYCVGLICFHKMYDYVCVIRGWEPHCLPGFRDQLENLKHGRSQPFYHITAVDQSNRCVPQESLMVIPNPSRLYHLEEAIGKDFSHFNGFYYVGNKEKLMMYPDDLAIAETYAAKTMMNLMHRKVRRY